MSYCVPGASSHHLQLPGKHCCPHHTGEETALKVGRLPSKLQIQGLSPCSPFHLQASHTNCSHPLSRREKAQVACSASIPLKGHEWSAGWLYISLIGDGDFPLFLFLFFLRFFFMWAIIKLFIEFVTILLLFYILDFWPRGTWGT